MCKCERLSKSCIDVIWITIACTVIVSIIPIVVVVGVKYNEIVPLEKRNSLFVETDCLIENFQAKNEVCTRGSGRDEEKYTCYGHWFTVDYTIDTSLYAIDINHTEIYVGTLDHPDNYNINLPVGGHVTCYYNKCRLNPYSQETRDMCKEYGKGDIVTFDLETRQSAYNAYYFFIVVSGICAAVVVFCLMIILANYCYVLCCGAVKDVGEEGKSNIVKTQEPKEIQVVEMPSLPPCYNKALSDVNTVEKR